MTFVLKDLDENEIRVENIISFELVKSTSAACDGLRLKFETEKSLGEIYSVEAFWGEKSAFFGYADAQREALTDRGKSCFVYARSSASLLLDNEAAQATLTSPSADALFQLYAKPLGFKNKLPRLCSEHAYTVGKGTTCFGAINGFVSALAKKNVVVTPQGELCIFEADEPVSIDPGHVIRETRATNRGKAILRIDYKTRGDYIRHYKSRYFEGRKIKASRRMNLAPLSDGQRVQVLSNRLNTAALEYKTAELTLNGLEPFELYAPVKYSSGLGVLDGYYVASICLCSDKNGQRTSLTLNKNIDLEEINYVD